LKSKESWRFTRKNGENYFCSGNFEYSQIIMKDVIIGGKILTALYKLDKRSIISLKKNSSAPPR